MKLLTNLLFTLKTHFLGSLNKTKKWKDKSTVSCEDSNSIQIYTEYSKNIQCEKNNKLNLLMMIPELGYGGAARSFSQLSAELSKLYTVTVVVLGDDGTNPIFYKLGGKLIYLKTSLGGGASSKLARFIRRIILVRKIKKNNKIDISISFLEGADYINVLSKNNDKVILSIRGSKTYDGNIIGSIGWLRKNILIPFLYSKADFIHCVNSGVSTELKDDFKIRNVPIKVIYNFYDIDVIRANSSALIPNYLNEVLCAPYLIIVSRLAREKNILPLIKVFSALKKMGIKHRLLIVGDGPELNKIESLCHSLGLSVSIGLQKRTILVDVICIGADKNPYKYIKSASAFIMASESEGFPNALAEAMVLSVPVISADCPWGPREILHPDSSIRDKFINYPLRSDYGVLMPQLSDRPTVIENWAINLYSILKDEDLLNIYRKKSTEAISRYSKTNVVNEWVSIINQLRPSQDLA